jgi:undecaprenyl pyrophosphate phosphatase UppP
MSVPNLSGPEATIMVGCLAATVAVIGWVVVHRTTLTREREARAHADKKRKSLAGLISFRHCRIGITRSLSLRTRLSRSGSTITGVV